MSTLTAEPLSRVQATPVNWLWHPFLPRGKLTLLDGDPGIGKSLITVDLAARLSRGGEMPFGPPAARPHVVLLVSGEDAAADTTRPRAVAAGAALDRLHVISAEKSPHLPACLPEFERLIRDVRADLLVIDPLMAFLPPQVSDAVDQCVRTALTPLAALAERTDCGVLLVRHLRKRRTEQAIWRGQGSMGILGAARTALLAGPHPADPSLGVLAVTKSNLTDTPPSLGYRIVTGPAGMPVVQWAGVAELTADAVGGKPPPGLKARDRAGMWLYAELQNGPRRATDLYTAATEAGIPERTLDRVKQSMGVRSQKVGRDGVAVWYWYDPDAPWPADAPFRKPYELPPLDPLPSLE